MEGEAGSVGRGQQQCEMLDGWDTTKESVGQIPDAPNIFHAAATSGETSRAQSTLEAELAAMNEGYRPNMSAVQP